MSAARALRKQPAAEALPWLAQQTAWHWGGMLRRSDLARLAADAGLAAEAAFHRAIYDEKGFVLAVVDV